jgi:hypothetical protein
MSVLPQGAFTPLHRAHAGRTPIIRADLDRSRRMKTSLALLVLLTASVMARADCCDENKSHLDDIVLVRGFLHANEKKLDFSLSKGTEPGDAFGKRNADFFKKCRAGTPLYISEFKATRFDCKRAEEHDESYGFEAIALTKRVLPQLTNSPDDVVFTLSFAELSSTAVTPSPITGPELREVIAFLRPVVRIPKSANADYKYENVLGRSPNFDGVHTEKPIKVILNENEVYFVPSILKRGALEEEDVLTSVVIKDGTQHRLVGTIEGCIVRFGADLDHDRYPEVLTRTCSSSEYNFYSYVKFLPTVKRLVSLGW